MRSALSAVFALCFVTCSLSAVADSFENEINVDYLNTHSGNGYTAQEYRLLFTRYLAPVGTDSGPLGEAAFLSRTSSIGANLSYMPDDGYTTQIGYGFAAAFASTHTPLTASAGVTRINYESQYAVGSGHGMSTFSSDKHNVNIFHGSVGTYVGDRSHIGINYTRFEQESWASLTADAWELSGKHLAHISENQAISISASASRLESNDSFSSTNSYLKGAMEYYFTRTTSIGARVVKSTYENIFGDPTSIDRTLSVSTFITKAYRVGISYSDYEFGDRRTVDLNIRARF